MQREARRAGGRQLDPGERNAALRILYREDPARGRIVKRAHSGPADGRDPYHGIVVPHDAVTPYGVSWRYGLDRAVGGLHDAPNPGEMLCGALAACADGTVRMLAGVLGVELEALEVEVSGTVDVRGSLGLEADVPVGFERMALAVRARGAPGTPAQHVRRLLAAAERLCIVLDTLRRGVEVEVTLEA